MKSIARLVLPALLSLVLHAAPATAGSDDPAFVTFSVGVFDAFDADNIRPPDWDHNTVEYGDRSLEFGVQYRSDYKLWIFKPHAGAIVTGDSGKYGYAGLLTDVYFGRRFVLTPSTAVGAFHEGNGKDLGSVLQFRSGLELAYRFDSRARIGLGIYHMSNANLTDKNPGAESLTLNFSLPTNILFK